MARRRSRLDVSWAPGAVVVSITMIRKLGSANTRVWICSPTGHIKCSMDNRTASGPAAAALGDVGVALNTKGEILAYVETVFGGDEARIWLSRPHPLLGGQTPRQCLRTQSGTDQVRNILVAIRHGGVV